MKKKKISLLVLILACVFLFTGCPNPDAHIDELYAGGVEIEPDKSSSTWKYVVLKDLDDVQVRLEATGNVGSYNVTYEMKDKYGNGKGSSGNGCSNRDSNTIQKIDLNTLTADLLYNFKIKLYSGSNCSGSYLESVPFDIYTYVPSSDDGELGSPTQDIVNLVGGDSGYCNKDANGNKNVADTDNLFVKIAYSQVGYKEKKSSSSLSSCTANPGSSTNNCTKYSNSCISAGWCSSFITWTLTKSGITPPFEASTTDMSNWADRTGRLSQTCKNGDLALYNGHVAIVYIPNSGSKKYLIHGNWNDVVELRETTNYSLSNTTFKGCISMKDYTY